MRARTGEGFEIPDRPLRVLMVTGIYPTERKPYKGTFIRSQVEALIAAGLDVRVIHPDPGRPTLVRYLSAAGQVLRAALAGKYDIVHGHYSLWCAVARLYWRAPLICSFLGDDVLGTVSTTGGYGRKGKMVGYLSHLLCYLSSAVIVKSPEMRQRAGGPRRTLFVIPNGVNFEQFHPILRADARAALGWHAERNYVLFPSDPQVPTKHYRLATGAMEKLRARGLEADLVVIHDAPHDAVVQYMNASNALLLSSLVEGSPNVVKEAMACNIPVVSTDVGDVREVIGRTTGCSVCPHDADALAEGLERALRHRGPTTGREDIRCLENRLVAQRLIALYHRVLDSRRRERR
jgi:glycosyltransferase involved in cell wall biosynthesis